ncbi:MAG: DEAD/DEAH box helicase [Thermosynechococcaceae cyanobacterium MS004]|nr:DEAD/DEAH box helicase [Thermosynechococcaceae cyanobacterium MS004]
MAQDTAGFEQLHEGVQRWIWEQGWSQLRPIQAMAIAPILSGQTDLIISAATAGGKTEAAFLPIFSRLLQAPASGIRVLGISPLKALINDQQRRLSELGDRLDIPVTPWHGDVAAGPKQAILKNPAGIVLITPESLEALLARRGAELPTLFGHLDYMVIDEMHCFIGSERGCQLQSLMHRVEVALGRTFAHKIPRIGLSATLGDMSLAAKFLRPGNAEQVQFISPTGSGTDLKVQVRGYRKAIADWATLETGAMDASRDELEISQHLFKTLRGSRNLIFMNGRASVEKYADLLNRLCAQHQVPNEFWPHHGSLSKELREDAEALLKSDRPSNLVCTTTLEMGIDVGAVVSVAQVGAPMSVASMRQRIGRSGRRAGDPAIARFYISVPDIGENIGERTGEDLPPQDGLYPELVQAIAILNLLLTGWCEPPLMGKLHLSTLIQQVLSLIVQEGGVRADRAWQILCQTGPFQAVNQEMFIRLLRDLGQQELIQQSQDGSLLIGVKGDRLVRHYSFYSAFATPQEYRILQDGKFLGTLPIEIPLTQNARFIFAGKRWIALAVDDQERVVEVAPTGAGKLPKFSGGSAQVHDRVRQEMYRLYRSDEVPSFLDAPAQHLLQEARTQFTEHGLHQRALLAWGKQTLLFCWQGDRVMNTLLVQLQARGLKACREGLAIAVHQITPEDLWTHLGDLVDEGPADAVALAATVVNQRIEKHDVFLSEPLRCLNYAASHLDPQAAWESLKEIVDGS